jgi:hypothetical protein
LLGKYLLNKQKFYKGKVTFCIQMVTETTVKISRWVSEEIENFVNKDQKNKTEFPSKKNLVDKAVISLLKKRGVKLK